MVTGGGCSLLSSLGLSLMLMSGLPLPLASVWGLALPGELGLAFAGLPPSCLDTLCLSHCLAATLGSSVLLRGCLFLLLGLCTCCFRWLDTSVLTSLQSWVSCLLSPP